MNLKSREPNYRNNAPTHLEPKELWFRLDVVGFVRTVAVPCPWSVRLKLQLVSETVQES